MPSTATKERADHPTANRVGIGHLRWVGEQTSYRLERIPQTASS